MYVVRGVTAGGDVTAAAVVDEGGGPPALSKNLSNAAFALPVAAVPRAFSFSPATGGGGATAAAPDRSLLAERAR